MKALRCCLADSQPKIDEVEVTIEHLIDGTYATTDKGIIPSAYLFPTEKRHVLEELIVVLTSARRELQQLEARSYNVAAKIRLRLGGRS